MTLHYTKDDAEAVPPYDPDALWAEDWLTLHAEVTRLRAALEQIEYVPYQEYAGDSSFYCPWCGSDYKDGHANPCPRVSALRPEEER